MEKINKKLNTSLDHFFGSTSIVNPKRDWKILLMIFGAMIAVALIFDTFIYTQIANGDMYISVNKDELTLEMLKTTQLKNIIDDFQARKAEIGTRKAASAIDPSL